MLKDPEYFSLNDLAQNITLSTKTGAFSVIFYFLFLSLILSMKDKPKKYYNDKQYIVELTMYQPWNPAQINIFNILMN
jgi:hypothetical protein